MINGFSGLRVGMKVAANASSETIDELIEIAKARSPLADIIQNPTSLSVERVY